MRIDTERPSLGPSVRHVGVLTEMDPWSASTRYRALQHVPRLRALFPSVEVSLAGDTMAPPSGILGRMRYFGTHAGRYGRRTLRLRGWARSKDALFVQRGLYVLGPGANVAALRGFGGPLVFDLDDAVFRP